MTPVVPAPMAKQPMAKQGAVSSAVPSDGADLISGLSDDLLLHVLGFLPAATGCRDMVRTSALSRRWRHLWKRVPALRFASGEDVAPADGRRFNAVVGAVLGRRLDAGAGARVEALEISTAYWPGRVLVDAWLRLAAAHVAGTFALVVAPPPPHPGRDQQLLGELPATTSAAALRLSLGHATLQLPAAAAFRELAELSLFNVALAPGQGGRLGALLSSPCCPRLRRVSLEVLSGLPELRLEAAGALESLELAFLLDLRRLHVDAGALRVLRIRGCFAWTEEAARAGSVAIVRAPALVELACPRTRGTELLELGGGCPRVRRLGPVCIRSHLLPWCDPGENDFAVELLRRCTAAHRLHVCLEVPPRDLLYLEEDVMAEIPDLSHVTDLTVEVSSPGCHAFGASVANLLARCINLRRLRVDIVDAMEFRRKPPCLREHCACDAPSSWRDERMALPHLREAAFVGFAACYHLAPLLLAGAPGLDRRR
ncbi:unnamed protein product [Urochloa decumbens]|uniref:F-box domain-containing protein n=1 Tax=Urochloa decumbens TaxID=240449 RepID=A0ABC9FWB0_9POAL